MPTLEVRTFAALGTDLLYEVLRLRAQVFVVEQASIYQDPDGHDQEAMHLLGFLSGRLMAYARWYPSGEHTRLGRVLVTAEHRGRGYARMIVARALQELSDRVVDIEAQTYLEGFYASFGFSVRGPVYVLDGIPHLPMQREAAST